MSLRLTDSIRRVQQRGLLPVVSEIKVRSPKEGDLLQGRRPELLAQTMAASPIAGLSVVTEPRDFGGDLELIRRVRPLVPVPILRKDFMRTERDLDETADAGANAVLLTVCKLEDAALGRLHAAARERGLETLVEVHSAEEVRRIEELGIEPDILGINNRDILVGETDDGDVSLTELLAPTVAFSSLVLSESAIGGPADAARARAAGADAVLVGTSVLQAPDTTRALEALIYAGQP